MPNRQRRNAIKEKLDHLAARFFQAVSFETGEIPQYKNIRLMFIEAGLLIKNNEPTPEVSSLNQFIESRQAMVDSGELTSFHERELSETTEILGNIAHRFSSYEKRGISKGVEFETRGRISTQFILTPEGWRMSVMAWDDDRNGVA